MNLDQLTKAERRVFDCLVTGQCDKDIAAQMFRSIKTIECHVHQVLSKLHISTRALLIVTYYQEKLREATSGIAQLSAQSGTAGERGVDARSERPSASPQVSAPARVSQSARAVAVPDLPALMRQQDNFDHR